MIIETGELFVFLECPWTEEYSVIVARARGKDRMQKIPKAGSYDKKGIFYVGKYL